MKVKYLLTNIYVTLLILLFVYTSASKILDHHNFVLQMSLAPFSGIKPLAPFLGFIVPAVEFLIAMTLAAGLLNAAVLVKPLIASAILLLIFESYIAIMLLSGSRLPCSCGGIISTLGWKEHLIVNAILIGGAVLSVQYVRKYNLPAPIGQGKSKVLSRA